MHYTQFPSQDSGLFGPNPWKILVPPSNYLSKKVSGQPNPWKRSCEGKSCDGELGVKTERALRSAPVGA